MAVRAYKLAAAQIAATGYTDLFVIDKDTFVINATTAHVLTALAVGDVVRDVMTEVVTAVAGPTATVSAGIVGSLTLFTPASDVATATAVPYVTGKPITVGTGFIAATSGGAVTTALTNSTSGVVSPAAAFAPYAVNTAVNMVANAIVSNTAITAGEVWVWANISRLRDRNVVAGQH